MAASKGAGVGTGENAELPAGREAEDLGRQGDHFGEGGFWRFGAVAAAELGGFERLEPTSRGRLAQGPDENWGFFGRESGFVALTITNPPFQKRSAPVGGA